MGYGKLEEDEHRGVLPSIDKASGDENTEAIAIVGDGEHPFLEGTLNVDAIAVNELFSITLTYDKLVALSVKPR